MSEVEVAQSCLTFVIPWTVACQAPLSMGVLQARMLEGIAVPSFRDLPSPGIKPKSSALQAESLPSTTREALVASV